MRFEKVNLIIILILLIIIMVLMIIIVNVRSKLTKKSRSFLLLPI